MMNFLDSLNALGHTIIMITHDMQLVLEYSDRVLVISRGQILADQSPVELFSQPELLAAANLKQTSLFDLAKKLSCDPISLTRYYIEHQGGQDE